MATGILVGLLLTLSSCSTVTPDAGLVARRAAWEAARAANTRDGYHEYAARHPDDLLAEEARRWVADGAHAFVRTAQIGTRQAWLGFVAAHAGSTHGALARARLQFLDAIDPAAPETYRAFADRHPDHPFAPEARATIPLLWLRRVRAVVSVEINIGRLAWKGIRGGYGIESEVSRSLRDRVQRELAEAGVAVVEMAAPPDAAPSAGRGLVVVVDYSERPGLSWASEGYPGQDAVSVIMFGLIPTIAGKLVGKALDAVAPFTDEAAVVTIRDTEGTPTYYSFLRDLSVPVDKVGREALDRAGASPLAAWMATVRGHVVGTLRRAVRWRARAARPREQATDGGGSETRVPEADAPCGPSRPASIAASCCCPDRPMRGRLSSRIAISGRWSGRAPAASDPSGPGPPHGGKEAASVRGRPGGGRRRWRPSSRRARPRRRPAPSGVAARPRPTARPRGRASGGRRRR